MNNNTKSNKKPIQRESNIMDIINTYPSAIDVFQAFGLHCTTCFASAFDTVYEGAKMHGMLDDEIDEMIEEANMVVLKDSSVDLTSDDNDD